LVLYKDELIFLFLVFFIRTLFRSSHFPWHLPSIPVTCPYPLSIVVPFRVLGFSSAILHPLERHERSPWPPIGKLNCHWENFIVEQLEQQQQQRIVISNSLQYAGKSRTKSQGKLEENFERGKELKLIVWQS